MFQIHKGVSNDYSSRQQPKRNWLRKVDWILVLVISLLALTSVILISSAMGGGQYSEISVLDKLFIIFSRLLLHFNYDNLAKKIKIILIFYIVYFAFY